MRDQEEFQRQKDYVLELLSKVEIEHSFFDANGSVFDCIPIEQQPALRRTGTALAAPPELPQREASPPSIKQRDPDIVFAQLDSDENCPAGAVPIRRITLDELNRFSTLDEYLSKPQPMRQWPSPDLIDLVVPSQPHAYAYQDVPNLGGHTNLSVWSPPVASDQGFSVGQMWCLGSGPGGAQTVEAGWQVYPQMYKHTRPALFAFWSNNNYAQRGYDYSSFVQWGNNQALGMAFNTTSVIGGPEVSVELSLFHTQGNWWLFLNGIDQQHAIGYFPGSLFAGGSLANGATRIEFGGETAGSGSFPPMGSGTFAAAGDGQAAAHRQLHYFSPTGVMTPANLTPTEEWPAAYTAQLQGAPGTDPTLYFGGPGSAGPRNG